MSGDDRGHDSDAYRALRSEIDQLRQELADVKQQQATTNGPTRGPQMIKIDGVAEDVATPVSEALQDVDEEVALEESTWVFPLLLGDLLGWATSTYLCFLLLITAAIQGLFLFLLADEKSDMVSPLTREDVEGLRMWRRTVAHDFKYYNELEEASLASRVCGGNQGRRGGAGGRSGDVSSALELSGSQEQLYADLSGVPRSPDPRPHLTSAYLHHAALGRTPLPHSPHRVDAARISPPSNPRRVHLKLLLAPRLPGHGR